MVRAMVRLVKTKNCFVNLPPHVARGVTTASEGAVILRLSWEAAGTPAPAPPSWAFASWNGGLSDPESGAIEVPLALARVIGLAAALDSDAYLSVRAEPAGYVPTASRVSLEPLSSDDWEILEANAEHLEGQMLTQVCVAYPGQVMPIWVHNTSLIALRVVSAETFGGVGGGGAAAGAACVRLTAQTEVAVSPKPRRRRRLPGGEARQPRFRSSGLLRVAPPPPGWKAEGSYGYSGGGGGGGRPYLLMHPATLAGIDGWNNSPSSRAPWPSQPPPLDVPGEEDGRPGFPTTSPPPAEALAVLWRDGSFAEPGSGRAGAGGAEDRVSLGGDGGGGGGGSGARGAAAGRGSGGRDPDVSPRARRVVAILREDGRVPPGHVAVAQRGGRGGWAGLRERAGLTALRRVARIRVLSSAEGARVSPRLVFRRVVPRYEPTASSGPNLSANVPTVGNLSAVTSEGEAAAVTFREALRHALSGLLGEAGAGNGPDGCRTCGYDGGSSSGEGAALDGIIPQGGTYGGVGVGAGGGQFPELGNQQQRQQRSVPRSASGSGLRQLASPTRAPLVLDHGAVISLPRRRPAAPLVLSPSTRQPPPLPPSPSRRTPPHGCRATGPAARTPAAGIQMDDFVVEFYPARPARASGSPPSQHAAASAAVTGYGEEPAAAAAAAAAAGTALHYAVVACQEDVDRAVADAVLGGDVLAADLCGAATVAEEEARGGEGGAIVLGGVEEQMRVVSNLLAPVLVRPVAAARARLGVAAAAGGVVVHGASGAGKTALVAAVARRLRESYLSMAGTETVSCRDLQGRKMSDVLGALEEAFASASRHAPSLVVLDDLDKIAPAEGEEGAGAYNAQAARIAERLEDLFLAEVSGESAKVAVLATAASVSALHPRLTRSGMLDEQVEIPPPRPAARVSILQSLVRALGPSASDRERTDAPEDYDREGEYDDDDDDGDGDDDNDDEAGEEGDEDDGIDWEYLSSKTEGCQARDLAKVVKRALLHSALRRMKEAETEITAAAPGGGGGGASDGESRSGQVDGALSNGFHHRPPAGGGPDRVVTGGNPALALTTTAALAMSTRGGVGDGERETGEEAYPSGAAAAGIDMEDLEAALEGFSAESLRGAGLFRSSVEWGDVGGLRGVRAELREILELPVKYARLFEATPTRLPTGALLYGPPGCGKTLLAGAVAAECGLNFISVKGPEVLDKYIGASEQAVRSLFARAASAAPCVLFFDEFEAVAPRRGNDNTGVTDRVVNQLLTFLDGVEGRDGVYVLGATSRPDLIDSALLRPGRLDRQLYCGFPDEAEREDILRAVCRKTPMSEEAREVALARVAASPKAEAFTGADLQAVIDTAQLAAIHSYLEALQLDEGVSTVTKSEEAAAGGGGGGGPDGVGRSGAGVAIPFDEKPAPAVGVAEKGRLGEGAALNGDVLDTPPAVANGTGNGSVVSDGIGAPSYSRRAPKPVNNGDGGGAGKREGVEVSADDVWEAFLATRPSLSGEDRARYDSAYRKFRGGSRPADFNPISSVDDGTLRTALK